MLNRFSRTGSVLGLAALLLSGMVPPTLAADRNMPLLDGQTWPSLTNDSKLSFVWGIAHVAEYQRQLGGRATAASAAPSEKDFPAQLNWALKGRSLGGVVGDVDRFYSSNPGQRNVPVLNVIARTADGGRERAN